MNPQPKHRFINRDLLFTTAMSLAFILIAVNAFGVNLSGWRTDFSKSSVDMDEIVSGGVGRDGIPPIDNPHLEAISQVESLQPHSPVIALEINGDARAYPLAILTRHEIVNDAVGGVPVAVTFCPLCNSAIAYDRRVGETVLRFGVSGNLRNSDLIMWDDQTESWWQQLTGEAIVGEYTGTLLDVVPSQVVGYAAFASNFPDGQVVTGDQDKPWMSYGRNPYVGYDSNHSPLLFTGKLDTRLPATRRVFVTLIEEIPIAYPFTQLARQRVIHDRIGVTDVVIFWKAGASSALDAAQIDESKDVGMAAMFIPRLNERTLTFRAVGQHFLDNETHSQWNIFGQAVAGELAGERLEQVNAFPHFWFAWAAFYPDTLIYE